MNGARARVGATGALLAPESPVARARGKAVSGQRENNGPPERSPRGAVLSAFAPFRLYQIVVAFSTLSFRVSFWPATSTTTR